MTDLSEAQRYLIAEAVLGDDAHDFFNTELGKFVIGAAQQERLEALEALATAPWWNRRRIMLLQNKAYRPVQLLSWLNELIIRGQNAKSILKENEDDRQED